MFAQRGDHVARAVFERDGFHAGGRASALDAFVPTRGLQRFDDRADWSTARREGRAGHIPIADVAGREDDTFTVRVGGFNVLPAVDADVVDQLSRFDVRQAHEVDHVARIVGEGGFGHPTRFARICLRAENLAHIVGGAVQVAAGEQLQHQGCAPRRQAVSNTDWHKAHQEGSGDVEPIHHEPSGV